MGNKTRVNILSSSRFHMLDLARELDKRGFDVMFYSYIPSWRAATFGLPAKCCSSIYWLVTLLAFVERKLFPRNKWLRYALKSYHDTMTSWIIRKADVTIALSGNFPKSIDKAKKMGDLIIVERGSKHILEQKRILESIPANIGRTIVDKRAINRELHDYEQADYVSVASEHVKRSFLTHGFPQEKLFVNPYGVDVSQFTPSFTKDKKHDLLMVGNWSYQKGCDLIVQAVRRLGISFFHVGNIVDVEFPLESNFTHIDAVPQSRLVDYYHHAKVFILPSRQDGFGMVLSQALACNLPIVGSPDCGAPDLKKLVARPEYVTIIKDYDVESVIEAINESLQLYEQLGDIIYAGDALKELTWDSYGKRYADFIRLIMV